MVGSFIYTPPPFPPDYANFLWCIYISKSNCVTGTGSVAIHTKNKQTNKKTINFTKIFVICILHSNMTSFERFDSKPVFALILFHLFARKSNLENLSIYSNKLFHNFHLSESSFTFPGHRASGLAWRLPNPW